MYLYSINWCYIYGYIISYICREELFPLHNFDQPTTFPIDDAETQQINKQHKISMQNGYILEVY